MRREHETGGTHALLRIRVDRSGGVEAPFFDVSIWTSSSVVAGGSNVMSHTAVCMPVCRRARHRSSHQGKLAAKQLVVSREQHRVRRSPQMYGRKMQEEYKQVAKYRARAPTASVETQWSKTLRSPWVMPPAAQRPVSGYGVPYSKPGGMSAADARVAMAGDAAIGRRQPFQQAPPRRLAPISAWSGNEAGNPSFYPLPLGRHVFSARWVPLTTQ